LKRQAEIAVRILNIFRAGALILDEVDLILHPLKSELNWPLGQKRPLDLTRARGGAGGAGGGLGHGLRWQVPFHLLDAVFYCAGGGRSVVGAAFQESRRARTVLDAAAAAVEEGCERKLLQRTPHLVLLSRKFYHERLQPLMAQWAVLWLRHKRLRELSDEALLDYLLKGPDDCDHAVRQQVTELLGDEHVKLLNLTHDWLRSFLPHVLGKVDRVGYGLLGPADLKRALALDPNMPKSRRLLAVPFVGKDVPSRASEFSHPDVVIGLSVLAYRYEGLRMTDFVVMLRGLRDEMDEEFGPYHERPACKTFVRWVNLAGGSVRGLRRKGAAN
ncbi:unnamed protein product, partial [Phaeothamnion confervicola]